MSLTPRDLRDEAARLRRQADALDDAAAALEGRLPANSTSDKHLDVTNSQAQALRRGAAIAKSRATHPIARAIVDSQWRSQARYVKARLRGLSASSFSHYLTGKTDVPIHVMDRVREDFGLGDEYWAKPEKRRR